MRAARQGLAWVVAPALLACSASAWGAEPGPDVLPISVIAVQTADADDQAEALTKALRTAVRATPGWSLGEGDYSLEVLTLSLKCPEPPDASCQSRIADQIKADRYIWGVIQKELDGLVASLKQDDLDRLINKLATGATVGGERPQDRMHRLGRLWTYLNEYHTLEHELNCIRAVTLDDLRETAAAFPIRPVTVGRLMPGELSSP